MSDEVEVIRPLDGSEIKHAVAMTIFDKVAEVLDKTCHLYGIAYPKFKAEFSVTLTMSRTPGPEQEFEDSVSETLNGSLLTHEFKDGAPVISRSPIMDPQEATVSGSIPYTPPNVVRKQHGMPVPTMVQRQDGTTEQKAVVFRKRAGEGFRGVTKESE